MASGGSCWTFPFDSEAQCQLIKKLLPRTFSDQNTSWLGELRGGMSVPVPGLPPTKVSQEKTWDSGCLLGG